METIENIVLTAVGLLALALMLTPLFIRDPRPADRTGGRPGDQPPDQPGDPLEGWTRCGTCGAWLPPERSQDEQAALAEEAHCGNCAWFEPNARTCHRYPPDAKGWQCACDGDLNWCGEWKKAPHV